eukprot:17343_5
MQELRAVLQKRKSQMAARENTRKKAAGGGPTSMFQTFGQIRSDVEEMNNKIGQMQEKIDTSAIVEKKVLLVLESLTNKVD